MRLARRFWRRWVRPLALATLSGFGMWAGAILLYDAAGGQGPLAPIADWAIVPLAFRFFMLFLGPILYAVATWRLAVRGAFIAFGGVGLLGPYLFLISPWQAVEAGPLAYFDEGRGWMELGLLIYNVGCVLVVPALTLAVRSFWRSLRPTVRA